MAYALATNLLRAVKNAGVKYNQAAGWKSHGRGTMGSIQTIVCHHTAGPESGNSPSLNVVRNGRPGLKPFYGYLVNQNLYGFLRRAPNP